MEKRALTKWIRVFTTEQVIDGLDRGVKTMKKGEVAKLTIHPEVPPCIMMSSWFHLKRYMHGKS